MIDLARVDVVEETSGNARIYKSSTPLDAYEQSLGELLMRWAADAPDRHFLAERRSDGDWRRVTYAQSATQATSLAQTLLDRGLGADRPVMLLSGNSIDHALLMLAGLLVGIPIVPVSVAYSLQSKDFAKLRAITELVHPGLVFADRREVFDAALKSLPSSAEVVTSDDLAELVSAEPTRAVSDAMGSVTGDTVAKILFTSGSTGEPKGVINTHRMLCANQQMLAQIWPFTIRTPPVLVDWLPWNHTFGGNHNFNLVLRRGGSLYIDDGRPAPGMIEKTVRNLAEISPTIYFNVPAGYGALLPYLESDPALAARFFERLQLIFYAGAALPQDLWERLDELAVSTLGERVMMTSSWGSTETSPLATAAHFPLERAGNIGVPVPGVEIKMVPSGDKLELRVRGPNVTPGYLRRPDLTTEAFDSDGFYRIGDAGKLANPDDPNAGILFDGRIAEDFKLTSGTWVPCGKLRIEAIAAASPMIQDAVVAGADRDYVGLLVWLNLAAASRVSGVGPDEPETIARSDAVRDHIRSALAAHNDKQTGSSTRIDRVLVMTEPPSIDANEITDKGYVNQRATLDRRRELVERLFADPPDGDVILIDRMTSPV